MRILLATTLLLLMACLLLSFKPFKKTTRVLFFGDSITEAGVQKDGYISQIRDSLVARGLGKRYELIGSGIGGNKVYDLYLRLEDDVLKKKPDVVFIYVGVNDVWHKQTHRTGTDADKFKRFYEALIKKLQQKGIKVVLCTPACIGERNDGGNLLDKELNDYSNIIRAIASDKQLALCDLRQEFLQHNAAHNKSNLDSGILTTDGVHLNTKGNNLVAQRLLEKLLA